MGKLWDNVKRVHNALDATADAISGVNKNNSRNTGLVHTDNGKCQMRVRVGNNTCDKKIKNGFHTCGSSKCEEKYWNEFKESKDYAPLPPHKKGRLINEPHRLENRRSSGHQHGTVMRRQVKKNGKWVWVDQDGNEE